MNTIKKLILFIFSVLLIATHSSYASSPGVEKNEIRVVIDAGHGGNDAGAAEHGVKEKDINLAVALKLAKLIDKELKGIKPILTRNNDAFISLQERANIANRNRGDLFISIHTNSVDKKNPNRNSVCGASVYALGLNKDANNLQVARRENSVIELESDYQQKYSGFDPSKDESYIIFEMAQKRNLAQSLKFADAAQKHLVADAGRSDRGVKQAGFWVLWATSMPSVLVELDFICNPQSAKFISSEEGQDKMAKALFNAVKDYFSVKLPKKEVKGEQSALVTKKNNKKRSANKDVDRNNAEVVKDSPEKKEPEPAVPLLVSNSRNSDKKTTATPQKEVQGREYSFADVHSRSLVGKRRRRSESSKRLSESREISCDSILERREGEYLAKADIAATVADNSNASSSMKDSPTPKGKKNKKKKEAKKPKELKTHKSISGKRPNMAKPITVYKIQILASSERLKENNPQFCGLKPIKAFREHDLYKYTYGESTERAEIEKMLRDVRKDIPDAFIITAVKTATSGSK